jgi:hypothetical protein
VQEFAELLVWLLVIALAITAIKSGPAGLRAWMRAKFLGRQPGE